MPTDIQMSQANIPRPYWKKVGVKLSMIPERFREATENLEGEFESGNNYVLLGRNYSFRLRVISWFAKQALDSSNRYARSSWDTHKPTKPNLNGVPFTVRVDEGEALMNLRLSEDEESLARWAFEPDIFILSELGAGNQNRNPLVIAVIDEVLRNRFRAGLMTIITMESDITDDTKKGIPTYKGTTRDLINSYEKVVL